MKYLVFLVIFFLFSCHSYKDMTTEDFLKVKLDSSTDIIGPLSIESYEGKNYKEVIKGKGIIDTIYSDYQWKKIMRKYKKGDELYKFRTCPETWWGMSGREGYIFIRKKRIIGTVITRMS